MKYLSSIVLVVVFMTSSAAYGANGFYAGVSGGATKVAEWCDGAVGSCDDTGTGWKVYGGAQLNPHLGIEAAYVDLGEVTATDTSFGFPIDAKAEVNGVNIALAGTLPVAGPLAFQGKIGLFLSSLDIRASGGGVSTSDSATSTGLAIGLGVTLSVTENVNLRGEWERFADVGDDNTGQDDIDLVSIGIGFVF